MRKLAAVAASILLLAGGAVSVDAADEHGPAHRHAPPETLGSVDFRTSCKPSVQIDFNRAVALMHSFQFGPAIKGFRQVLEVDPGCSIAYWGIALASWSNPFAGFKSPTQLAQGLA